MASILENVNLKPFNTFGIEVFCSYFTEVHSEEDFIALLQQPVYIQNKKLILGGGSNVLFTANFDGLVIKNNIKGIELVAETNTHVTLRVAAGEIWHDLVMWCINKNYAGIENLSLIPGCVGASPMQNIGAYGVEIKEVFHQLEALSMETGKKEIFSKEACEFGYRESVFKHKYKNRYIITAVNFILKKNPEINTTYGAISDELRNMQVQHPGIRDVSNAVMNIRRSKLPDPKETGNAGSFFKNPEVTADVYQQIKQRFPQLVAYPLASGGYKLAAGWLIEQCGLKGFAFNGAAVHNKQALVLIKKNHCTGADVYELSSLVLEKVFDTFGVTLEREVNIIG